MQSTSVLEHPSESAPREALWPRGASTPSAPVESAEHQLQQAAFWLEFDEVTAEIFTNLYAPHGYCARCGISLLSLVDHLVLLGIGFLAISLLATLQLANGLLRCARWVGKKIANRLFHT